MKLSLRHDTVSGVEADLLVVLVAGAPQQSALVSELDRALGGELSKVIKQEEFTAKKGQTLLLYSLGKLAAKKVRLIGVAPKDPTPADYRLAAVTAARSAKDHKAVAVAFDGDEPSLLETVAEGLLLGAYRYATFLTGPRKPKPEAKAAILLSRRPTRAEERAVHDAGVIAEAVNLARDMVNAPPNEMTASALANEARRVSRAHGIRCTVWGKAEIKRHGMTLLSAVNAGSSEEPRFVHMVYTPKQRSKKKPARLVFVGKGLTFDAGGLSIKPAKSMETMKCDMAGGAATIGIVMAAARLELPVEVHGVVPSTDNLLGSGAFKPGDVYRTLDGKTVEVLNTDAEGRLILADALTYARKLNPTVLIDHATLTGACMAALGQWRAGLYANDDALVARYHEAGKRAGEAFWPMPLDEELKETIKSSIADIKNTGDGYGGSVSAALFLQAFVGDAKWVHLDIAGPAFLSAPHDLSPKGGTGFGVRTALEFIKTFT